MSRDLPTDLSDEIAEPYLRPFLAVRIELPDPVYAWTGEGAITFNDSSDVEREWQTGDGIGAIEAIAESTDGSATGMKVTLFAVPAQFREDIADQAVRGALFEIYVGVRETGEDWSAVKATKMIWRGRVDDFIIVDTGTTISVEIAAESRAIDQRRPAIKRFTDEYQQRKYPGDLFFQYVPQMAEIPILWAAAEQSVVKSGGTGSAGGGGGFNGSASLF